MKRKLKINLGIQNQQVQTVCSSLPKFNATALLAGQNTENVASKLGMVLSICRQAQSIAALSAVAATERKECSETVWDLCQVSVMIENLQESIRTFCFNLPPHLRPDAMIGDFSPIWRKSLLLLFQLSLAIEQKQKTEQKKIRQEVHHLITLWDAFCLKYIHGISPQIWAAQNWDIYTISTPAIEWCKLLAKEAPELGKLDLPFLPVSEIHQGKLTWADTANKPYDATALRRALAETQIPSVLNLWGNAAVTRLWVRLLDMAKTIQALNQFVESSVLAKQHHCVYAYTLADGTGISEVECARGLLVHQITLDGAQVKTYQVYAPTDWNLHQDGALSTLIGYDASDLDRLRRHVEWLVQVLDPCVEYEINFTGAFPI